MALNYFPPKHFSLDIPFPSCENPKNDSRQGQIPHMKTGFMEKLGRRTYGLPTVRGKFINKQKSSVRGKQNFAQRGIFADPSQRGNDILAVCGKNQSREVGVGSEVSFYFFEKVQVQVTY